MQLYFIRHAQSTNNLLYDQTGSWDGRDADPELTSAGREQAQRLAAHIARLDGCFDPARRDDHNRSGYGFTHVYTSLMIRAASTGAPLASALGLPLRGWIDLHETGGLYLDDLDTGEKIGQPGLTRAELEARFPGIVLPESLNHTGWWNRPAETEEEKVERAGRFLDDLMARHGGTTDRVAVITHGAFYNRVLAALLNLPHREGLWFMLNNTAITRVDFRDGEVALVYMNRVDHLPDSLIT